MWLLGSDLWGSKCYRGFGSATPAALVMLLFGHGLDPSKKPSKSFAIKNFWLCALHMG